MHLGPSYSVYRQAEKKMVTTINHQGNRMGANLFTWRFPSLYHTSTLANPHFTKLKGPTRGNNSIHRLYEFLVSRYNSTMQIMRIWPVKTGKIAENLYAVKTGTDMELQKESIRKLTCLDQVELACTAHTGYTREFNEAMRDWK